MAAFGFGDRRAAGCFQHGEAQTVLNGVGVLFYGLKVLNCFSNIGSVSRFSEAAQHHFCEKEKAFFCGGCFYFFPSGEGVSPPAKGFFRLQRGEVSPPGESLFLSGQKK